MSIQGQRKRDGLHETPHATTRTPTAREMRYQIRCQNREKSQASVAKLASETLEINNALEEKFEMDAQITTDHKTLKSAIQPDKHHRIALKPSFDQSSSSPGGDLNTEHLNHPQRISNLSSSEQIKLTKISFPPSNSKIWKEIDQELEDAIPLAFPKSRFEKRIIY